MGGINLAPKVRGEIKKEEEICQFSKETLLPNNERDPLGKKTSP